MMILQQTRGLLSSNDQLALDLPFAETKSLAARIGPTPTFTRGSGATYVANDGLLHGVDTSTTSNTIGTGSKTFTLTATAGQDQLWRTGDAVDASNGSNSMVGTVTSYDASTQVLVCNITSVTGSGTFTSWRIGYRGPRFDHSPANPTICRGLLIEEGRTNLTLQSENFGTTWTNDSGAVTITTNVETSPNGSTSADKIAEASSTTNRRICIQNISVTSGTTYSYSCYIKAGERDFAQLAAGTGLNSAFQNFVVNGVGAGTLGSSSGIVSSRIDAMPNGWYRCTMVVTATATGATTITVGPAPSSTLTRWQAYASTAGSGIYAWGAQLEAGAFPTSYIPTTTSALARSADVCSISGANFTGMWNALEGSLFTSAIFNAPVAYGNGQVLVDVNDTTATNRLRYIRNLSTGTPTFANTSSNSLNVLITGATALQPFTSQKYSAGFKLNDYAFYLNNSQVGTDNLGSLLVSPTAMSIGDASAGTTRQYINGTISAIRYYKKRLDNTKLASLTV